MSNQVILCAEDVGSDDNWHARQTGDGNGHLATITKAELSPGAAVRARVVEGPQPTARVLRDPRSIVDRELRQRAEGDVHCVDDNETGDETSEASGLWVEGVRPVLNGALHPRRA